MTLTEINNLTLDDVFWLIFGRLNIDFSLVPEGEQPYTIDPDNQLSMYDRLIFHANVTKPLLAVFDSELTVYKNELIAAENERLRRKDLKDRFEALADKRGSFHSLHSEPNPAAWLENLLDDSNHANAESLMVALETKDVEMQANISENQNKKNREIQIMDALEVVAKKNLTDITAGEVKAMTRLMARMMVKERLNSGEM